MTAYSGPSIRRYLVSGGAWATAGKAATALLAVVANGVLARAMAPGEYGTFVLLFTACSAASLLGTMGLRQVAVRRLGELGGVSNSTFVVRLINRLLSLTAVGAAGAGLVTGILGITYWHLMSHQWSLGFGGALACLSALMTIQTTLTEIHRGMGDIRLATLFGTPVSGGGVAFGLLVTLGYLWLAQGPRSSVPATFLVTALSAAFTMLLSVYFVRAKVRFLHQPAVANSDRPLPRPLLRSNLLRVAVPMLVVGTTLYLSSQAGVWVLGAVSNGYQVAAYAAAYRLAALVAMPVVIVNAVAPPMIAAMYSAGERRRLELALRATATITGALSAAALLLCVVAGRPLLALVFGRYYEASFPILVILGVGQFVNVWSSSSGMVLLMTGNERLHARISVCLGGAAAPLWMGLAQRLGAVGMAAGFTGYLVLHNVITVVYAKRRTGLWTQMYGPLRLVAAGSSDRGR